MAFAGLIVGLGNPGDQYARTRHNFGFMVIDQIVDREPGCVVCSSRTEKDFVLWEWRPFPGSDAWLLLKPLTFMNRSGRAVQKVLKNREIGIDQILVIHDELDLSLGVVRFKKGGGLAGHNGLRSIAAVLASRDFNRLRMGIDRPAGSGDVSNYVLSSFGKDVAPTLFAALDDAVQGVEVYCQDGLEKAMLVTHSRS